MFTTALFVLIASALSVVASPGLSLKVAGPNAVNGVDNLRVVTTLTNTGDATLKLLNDPRGVLSDMPTNTFAISKADGSSPKFVGVVVKYVPSNVVRSTNAKSFTVLSPGQSIDVSHGLGSAYDFTPTGEGVYTFEASNLLHYVDEAENIVEIRATHEPIIVTLSGTLYAVRDVPGVISRWTRKRATFQGCSSTQQSQLQNAIVNAQTYAEDAAAYAYSLVDGTPRYTTWFGSYDSSRASTVQSHFYNISGNDFETFTYSCTCSVDQYPDVFAYVYPDQFGTITICNAFWSASPTGTDSQAGTIVHESSHFTDNGGTVDVVYGQAKCQDLATNDPEAAVTNADSHEYFAENTPFLT